MKPPDVIALVARTDGQRADFREIAQRAGDPRVRVVREPALASLAAHDVAISCTEIRAPVPCRLLCGRPLGKLEEMRRLAAGGVRVPRTEALAAGQTLEPSSWGPMVVIKPVIGMHGDGVRLVPASTAGKGIRGPHVAQEYIPVGRTATKIRALAFLGRVLYAVRITNPEPGTLVTSAPGKIMAPVPESDTEIDEIARRTFAAVPEVPVHGLDILTDTRDGGRYVIEMNARGMVWAFSSPRGRRIQRECGIDYYELRDAMGQAALALREAFPRP